MGLGGLRARGQEDGWRVTCQVEKERRGDAASFLAGAFPGGAGGRGRPGPAGEWVWVLTAGCWAWKVCAS